MVRLKRLLAPSFWGVSKKEKKWVVTPSPGPHPKFYSIPLSILATSVLKLVDTTSEAKKIIRKGEILVDGKKRKDYAYPVGLFDVVSIPKLQKHYRIVPTKKRLEIIEIGEKEAKLKICKVKGKTVLKKDKIQLNLHDSKNILVEKGTYQIGDSLLVELPKLKIVEHLRFEKGNTGIVSVGKDAGKLAKIKGVIKGSLKETSKVICEIDKESRIVKKENLFVIGKEKPAITIIS